MPPAEPCDDRRVELARIEIVGSGQHEDARVAQGCKIAHPHLTAADIAPLV